MCEASLNCGVACQNQAFVTVILKLQSYDIIEKDCSLSFHLIYYLCSLPYQSKVMLIRTSFSS